MRKPVREIRNSKELESLKVKVVKKPLALAQAPKEVLGKIERSIVVTTV